MTIPELENIFTYHSPKGTQQERYVELREKALSFALLVHAHCPESREKSLAITLIQQATQMANAAIAIHE